MTFLNPAILWALGAVSIPIIIHIFNLKRTKKIEFSTLMFLKEIQQSKYKKIKLKQLLILLCRIAFIILLVLMFARPFSKGFLGTADEKARSSVLIILDDSFSMQSRETSGNNFDNAKAKINEMLNILDPNDEVFFTTVSGINRLERSFLYKDMGRLRDTLGLLKTSDVSKNMNEVLYFAKEILRSASHSYREVYLFTDGQKSFIENTGLVNDGLKPDEQTRLNIVLAGARTPNNISIDTLNTVTKIFEKNKPVKIKAAINNHNNFNVLNKTVTISFGSYKDEKAIDIPANSTVDAEFIISPGVTGYAGGFIELLQTEIADDEISADNRQYFSFFIQQTVSLLMVSNAPSELNYINIALSSSEELMADSLGNRVKYFDIKQVPSGSLPGVNVNEFDAVIIAGKTEFSAAESEMLKTYIENGGGIIVYPGSSSNAESLNSNLLRILELPLVNGSFEGVNAAYKFDKIDFEHPVFEGIFRQGTNRTNVSIESPEIKSGLNLSTGNNAIPLITLNNEKNFLVEYSKGKGKLILSAVPPDMSVSDYPSKNLFSPITVRSILYLASVNNVKPAITGNDYFIDVKTLSSSGDSVHISNTAENNFSRSLMPSGSNLLLNLKNYTGFTANYKISQNNTLLYEFPANYDKKESQTVRLESGAIEAGLIERGISASVIKPMETVSASILELRTGRDIWQYFLLAALLFVILEYFIARSLSARKQTNNKQ